MIYEVIAANLKNYIDATGAAKELTPEKSVFQISIGGKKEMYGWHYIVYEGDCQFKRGLYTGEIFIDWNDEFKYREKSKKQIIRETTPDYEVNFKDNAEFEAFVKAAGQYVFSGGRKPKIRGSKLKGTKCDVGEFDDVLTRCFALQSDSALSVTDNDDRRLAARMALFSLAEAIKIEDVLHAYGYQNVIIVDPQDLTAMQKAVDDALASTVPAAIITRRPCLLIKRLKQDRALCVVDTEKCSGCRQCLSVGCPAVMVKNKKSRIDATQCVGCTVCAQVCPVGAISRKE